MMKVKTTKQNIATQAMSGIDRNVSMPMKRKAGVRSWAERPPEIASTMPRTQI